MKVLKKYAHYTKLSHLYERVLTHSAYQSYVFELVFHSKKFKKLKRLLPQKMCQASKFVDRQLIL